MHAQMEALNIMDKNTEAIENQTQMFRELLEKTSGAKKRSSTIRVEPRITWPTLGDDGPGGREVKDFYDKFEEFCSLANDGEGMVDREMLIALKNCLKQSRRKIYDNVYKKYKERLDDDEGPWLHLSRN